MKYMYEILCSEEVPLEKGINDHCFAHWLIKEDEIEYSVSKRCKYCNGSRWKVTLVDITEKEYFLKQLKSSNRPFTYYAQETGTFYEVKE